MLMISLLPSLLLSWPRYYYVLIYLGLHDTDNTQKDIHIDFG